MCYNYSYGGDTLVTEIITCDCCGGMGARPCWFYVDRKMDGAGSMEDIHKVLDLCQKCLETAFALFQKGNHNAGSAVYNEMSNRSLAFLEKTKRIV